jgi:CRISPR-associated protein Csb2
VSLVLETVRGDPAQGHLRGETADLTSAIAQPMAMPEALRWRCIGEVVPLTQAVALGDLLHRAGVQRFVRLRARSESSNLIGRGSSGAPLEGHRHAHWLSLTGSDDGYQVTSVAVWVPAGLDYEELAALASMSSLRGKVDGRIVRLSLELEGVGEGAQVLQALAGPSRRWRTLTPYVAPMNPRPKQHPSEHAVRYVRRDLADLGFPRPESVQVVGPEGIWRAFRTQRPDGNTAARPSFGVEITFPSQVAGPIVLGALRHWGLGVFWPRGEHRDGT